MDRKTNYKNPDGDDFCPTPPFPKDALTACLADRTHQCVFQSAPAASYIFVLANISELALLPNAFPTRHAEQKFNSSRPGSSLQPIATLQSRIGQKHLIYSTREDM
ncbi:hypothetical protein Q5P01_011295 [Channa striata]|uniref:Uncharacterized protein n=1 Tax=Channa striata TaxID=64152 RepID=A0AA88MTJ3_CHASR|nr:hypothetical protein Q5P01_011295 [Channa striata]